MTQDHSSGPGAGELPDKDLLRELESLHTTLRHGSDHGPTATTR